jgi:hypothetical protein
MCQSGATRLSADCCFSELASNPTKRVGLLQSIHQHPFPQFKNVLQKKISGSFENQLIQN